MVTDARPFRYLRTLNQGTPDIHGALCTARRAINIANRGMAIPLSGIVSPKAEALGCPAAAGSVGREVKKEIPL